MSDQLRQIITAKKRQLQRQLNAVPNFPADPQPMANDAETIIEFQASESQIEDQIRRLKESIIAIEEQQAGWNSLMHKMTEKERPKEQDVFIAFAAGNGNPENTLEIAHTTIEGLEDLLVKVRKILAKAKLEEEKASEAARTKAQDNALDLAKAQADIAKAASSLPAIPGQGLDADKFAKALATAMSGEGAVKLPKIQLPKFAGSRAEWAAFKRIFKATVEDRVKSNVVRMEHLLTSCEGEAKLLISSLDLTDANYEKAMLLFDKEYGDEKARLKELMMEMKTLKNCKTLIDVKAFRLQLETICMQLDSLGHKFDTTSSTMVCVELLTKLPIGVIRKLQEAEEKDPTTWDLQAFRNQLNAIVKADERAHLAKDPLKKSEETPSPKTKAKDKAVVFSNQVEKKIEKQGKKSQQGSKKREKGDSKKREPKKREPVCHFCDKSSGHWSSECKKHKTTKERRKKATDAGLCTKCLSSRHKSKDCDTKLKCFNCKEVGHHSALCDKSKSAKDGDETKSGDKVKNKRASDNDSDDGVVASSVCVNRDGKTSLSMCVRAIVSNPHRPNKKIEALVVFDSLSHLSFVKNDLRQKLGLPTVERATLPLLTFQAKECKAHECDLVNVDIQLCNSRSSKLKLYTTERLVSQMATVLLSQKDLKRAAVYGDCVLGTHESPDILIGIDQEAQFDVKNIESLPSGFTLKSSLLDVSSEQLLEDHFTLESIGISAENPSDSNSDQHTHQFFRETLKRIPAGNDKIRLEVSLPWNENLKELPSNYGLAKKRSDRTWETTKKDSRLLIEVPSILKRLKDAQFIEKLKEPSRRTEDPVHYLAYQFVWKEGPDGQVKGRMVLDGSAELRGKKSLNSCLERGPVLLNDLLGVILRYRLGRVAVLSDVEKAFLQLSLDERDRDVTRFLWPKDVHDLGKGYDTYRFSRLPFGLKPSPFLLAASIDESLALIGSTLSEEIRRNVYVDNVLIRANDDSEAEAKCKRARELFDSVCMPLREFVSNSKDALAFLDQQDTLTTKTVKVLGTKWDTEADELIYQFPPFNIEESWTLRKITRLVAKLYDPCGLYAPCMVSAKVALSDAWKWIGQQKMEPDHPVSEKKRKWDTPLPEPLQESWRKAISNWKNAVGRVDRRVTTLEGAKRYELHAYGDASEYAFGTCLYLVTRVEGKAESHLILAKGRVTPCGKTKWTIPRLELMATLLSARILKYAKSQLDVSVDSCTIWADAQCVIDWIKSTQRPDRFVKGKKLEIRKNKEFFLRHVPGVQNPADLLSRGRTIEELKDNTEDGRLWHHGPEFLLHDKSMWPGEECRIGDLPEEKENDQVIFEAAATTLRTKRKMKKFFPTSKRCILDPRDYSNWRTLRRVTAYVFRFIRKWFAQKAKNQNWLKSNAVPRLAAEIFNLDADTVLTVREHQFACVYLLRQDQLRYPPPKESVEELGIYTDERGIRRCKGKIDEAELPKNSKRPIYLNKESELTSLIVLDCHQQIHHQGTSATQAHLRKNYWVAHGRRTVGSIIRKKCPGCLRFKLDRFDVPEPSLPGERVVYERTFENVGLDYAGPFSAKMPDGTTQNVYVCLFTCMVTRNIALEVVHDGAAEAFIMAFRRFVSTRGIPAKVYSDHGSNLELGAKVIEQAFSSRGFQTWLAEKKVVWRHVTERAPWAGGFYEALVKLIKGALRKTVGRNIMRLDVFTTLVKEIEGFTNCRPLTFMSDDLEPESLKPLRPADFLFPAGESTELPHLDTDDEDETHEGASRDQLLAKLAKEQRKLKKYKREFYENYLPALRARMKKMTGITREPVVGEVVLIDEDDPRRLAWRLGRITELIPSKDGRVRTVKLWNGRHVLRRPTARLYPLEVDPSSPGVAEKITIKRKGKILDVNKTSTPQPRTHKMKLRRHKSPPDSTENAVMPILVFSSQMAYDALEELNLDTGVPSDEEEFAESNAGEKSNSSAPPPPNQNAAVNAAPSTSRRHLNPPAEHRARGMLVMVPTVRGRVGSRADRTIKKTLNIAANSKPDEKEMARVRRESELEKKLQRLETNWKKIRHQQYQRTPPPPSRHSPSPPPLPSKPKWRDWKEKIGDREMPQVRSRQPTPPNTRDGCAKDSGRSGHRHSTLPDPEARHSSGSLPVHSPSDSKSRASDRPLKRKAKETPPMKKGKRMKTGQSGDDSLTSLYSKTHTGLEPTLRVCRRGATGHERCPGIKPLQLDLNYFCNYPKIACTDVESPYQLVLIFMAIRQQKSKRTAEFVTELLLAGDAFRVWGQWKSRFGKLQRADATCAVAKWREGCLTAKDNMDNAKAPFAWTGVPVSEFEDAEVIRHWMSALNKVVAEANGRENVDSQVMVVGDQWSIQLSAALESVYNKPSEVSELVNLVKSHYFFGGTRHLVVLAGKDCIMSDGDHQQHFKHLEELANVTPQHVTIALVEPPKIPSREEAWKKHRHCMKRFLKTKKAVQTIALPQLNCPEVAPSFVEECVADDGLLKEMGVWIVATQTQHLLDLPMKLRAKAPKINVKGYYSGENLRGPSLDERIRKKLATKAFFLSCLCLFLLFMPTLNATDPMTCIKDSSTLYDLSDYLSVCALPLPGGNVVERTRALKVFHNNTQTHGRTASQCFRKVEEISYGQVLGMRSSHPPKIRYKRVTPEECRDWVRDLKCEIGDGTVAKDEKLIQDGDVHRTDRKAEVDYGSWYNPFSYGNGVATAENCFITPAPIAVSSLLDHIVSDAGDTRGCRYSAGQCQLPDKSVLVWEPERGLTCPFQELGVWQGSYYYEAGMYIWTADHGQFVLTFRDDAQSVSAHCDEDKGSQYVVADSGLVIKVGAYDSLSRYRSKRSQRKKPDPSADVEVVQNDVLATQLTAVTKHCEKNDKIISKRLRDLICNVAKDVYTPSKIEATILARAILGTDYVQAEFPTTKPILEVWRCQRLGTLNSSIAVTETNGQCHKRPPVRIVTESGEVLQRFLDTRLMVATDDPEFGPCETHRSHVIEINGSLWRMNQETAELSEEPNTIKLIHGVNNSWTLPDLDTLEFHNWVLLNQESPLGREEARTRGRAAKETVQRTSVHEKGSDSHSAQSRLHLPSWDEFVFGWVPTPPRPLVTLCIWAVALKLAWMLFLHLAWPYFGIKLLRSLLPETYQHLLPKIDQSRQLQDQLREQQQKYMDLIKDMEEQLDLLRTASSTQRPSTSTKHVAKTALRQTEINAAEDEQPMPPAMTGQGNTMGRGTTTRRTINRKAHFERLNFLKAGVSGSDDEE